MTTIEASRIQAHMEVIASDGEHIGKVDHLQDGKIKLTRADSPDGQHHFVPLNWIDHIDAHVHLNRTLAEIKAAGSPGTSEVDAVPNAGDRVSAPKVGGSEVDAKP